MSDEKNTDPLSQFSGKTIRANHYGLKDLFGLHVPVEALDLIFDAPGEMTMMAMRNELIAMSAVWDQAEFHLMRLTKARDSVVESVAIASSRLAKAEEPERTYMTQTLMDAADNLEAGAEDLMHLRGEDCDV